MFVLISWTLVRVLRNKLSLFYCLKIISALSNKPIQTNWYINKYGSPHGKHESSGKKKEEIEADIQALFEVLKSQKGIGMKEPLVDKDGFPRNDIDIHTVRTARHDINCLQNDHQAIMAEIEEELYKIHEAARANNPQRESMDTSDGSQISDEMKERLSPFLEVNKVDDGSPASTAQLQVGDKILQFGSITAQNFKSLQDIASVVQHSKGKPLTLTVSRSNTDVRLSLTPNTWSGKGLLGCNIVPLKKS